MATPTVELARQPAQQRSTLPRGRTARRAEYRRDMRELAIAEDTLDEELRRAMASVGGRRLGRRNGDLATVSRVREPAARLRRPLRLTPGQRSGYVRGRGRGDHIATAGRRSSAKGT